MFGKEIRTLSTFVFAAILFGSPSFAINITMTTLRHIEYPLGLLFVLMLSSLLISDRKNYLYKAVGAATLLALLILNDRYFLYTIVPASLLAVVAYYKNKPCQNSAGGLFARCGVVRVPPLAFCYQNFST